MSKEDTIRKQKTICEVDEDDGIYEKKYMDLCGRRDKNVMPTTQ